MSLTTCSSYLIHFLFLLGELNNGESFLLCITFTDWKKIIGGKDLCTIGFKKGLFMVWEMIVVYSQGKKEQYRRIIIHGVSICFSTQKHCLGILDRTCLLLSGLCCQRWCLPLSGRNSPRDVAGSPSTHVCVQTHMFMPPWRQEPRLVLTSQLVSQGLEPLLNPIALYHPGTVKQRFLPMASKLVLCLPPLRTRT